MVWRYAWIQNKIIIYCRLFTQIAVDVFAIVFVQGLKLLMIPFLNRLVRLSNVNKIGMEPNCFFLLEKNQHACKSYTVSMSLDIN